jgi:hypothetical protein
MTVTELKAASPENREAIRFCQYTMFGTWLGVVCLSGVGLAELFRFLGFSSQTFNWGVGAIAVIGCTFLILRSGSARRGETPDLFLRFYESPRYWGTVLLCTALLVFVLGPEAQAKPPQAEPKPEPQPVIEEVRELTFPPFHVTAVVVNGSRSSAIVNGRELWIGESTQGAKLISVSEKSVEFEKEGVSTNVMILGMPDSVPEKHSASAKEIKPR